MYQHRIDIILYYSRDFLGKRRASAMCEFKDFRVVASNYSEDTGDFISPCTQTFARIASRVSRSWYTRTGPLTWISQSVEMCDRADLPLCPVCKSQFVKDAKEYRNSIWDQLPGVIDLPSWAEMAKSDLSEEQFRASFD